MRLPIRLYRNSILANIISLLGSAWCLGGVCVAVSEDIVAGIILVVVGVICLLWANSLNERATFRKWIKRLKKSGELNDIANSIETAVKLYSSNPSKRTLKYIKSKNKAAAYYIKFNELMHKTREKTSETD